MDNVIVTPHTAFYSDEAFVESLRSRPYNEGGAPIGGKGPVPEARVEEALTLLRANPAMARARAELISWIDRARADLAELPDIPARTALSALCDYVVERSG